MAEIYPSGYAAMSAFGRTLGSIGKEWGDELVYAEANRQIGNARAEMLKQWQLLSDEMDKNPRQAEQWPELFKARSEEIKKAVLDQVRSPRAQAIINRELPYQMAEWQGMIARRSRQQRVQNINTDFDSRLAEYTENRFYANEQDLLRNVNTSIKDVDTAWNNGNPTVDSIPNEIEYVNLRNAVGVKQISDYLIQHPGKNDADVNNPQSFIKRVGIEGIEFGPDEIAKLQQRYKAIKTNQDRLASDELRKQQDLTGNKMLLDFRQGRLTDPQEVLQAQANNLISGSMATSLIKSMTDPSERETDLKKLEEVNQAILAFQLNPSLKNKQKAIESIYKNERHLDDTDAESKLNSIYAEIDSANTYQKKEAYSMMAALLGGEPDPLSPEGISFIFGNPKEEDAFIEAKIRWDAEIEKAQTQEKPLSTYDKRMKAVEIARQLKRDMMTLSAEEILRLPERQKGTKWAEEQGIELRKPGEVPYIPVGLESIWDQLTDTGKKNAMLALRQGRTAKELIDYFNERQ